MKIALDGPAGSGKGTICSRVADQLNLINFSSGEVYRLATYLLVSPEYSKEITNPIQIIELITSGRVAYKWNQITKSSEVWLDGNDIKPDLHKQTISTKVAEISKTFTREITETAEFIINTIHDDLICEGRNVATHIIPNANIKIYLDASPEIRTRRRMQDIINQGDSIEFDTLLAQIKERDRLDMTRDYAPLVRLPEAIYVDTSQQTIDQSVQQIVDIIEGASVVTENR